MEVKQSTVFRAPVRLMSAGGAPITGVAYTSISTYTQKQAGSVVQKGMVSGDWFELSSANMPGIYDLQLSASETDTVGFFKYYVSHAQGAYAGVVEVVANIESDSVAAIAAGTASLSAAISNASSSILSAITAGTSSILSAITAGTASLSATIHAGVLETSATISSSLSGFSPGGGGGSGTLMVVVGSGETSYPISSTMYVSLGLFNTSSGLPVTGVGPSQVTATLFTQTGTVALALTTGTWQELVTGSFTSSGVYIVTIGQQYSYSAAHMVLGVRVSGADPAYLPVTVAAAASGGGGGTVDLSSLGTPIITIARDIIQVGSNVQDIKARVMAIQQKVRAT